MSKTTLQHSKVIRSLAAAVVIICMVVFIGSGLVVMGDENFTSGVSEYVLLDDGTAEPVEQQEEDIWAAPPTDSSAAAETPSVGSVSPELQEKVIAFLHRMTGDMGLDLCAPFVQKNPEYIGGYNPAKPIDQKWIDPYYHVYSVMAGSDDQVPGEILSFSLGNAGLHGIKLVFTEDGYLQVRTDDWGTCSLYRYRYDDAQGSMVDAGTGKGEIQGNPFAGEETYWEYTVNGEVVDRC